MLEKPAWLLVRALRVVCIGAGAVLALGVGVWAGRQQAAAKAQYCAEVACTDDAIKITDGSTYPTVYRDLANLAVSEVSPRVETSPVGVLVDRRVEVAADTSDRTTRLFQLPRTGG